MNPTSDTTFKQYMRQITDPLLQVTGGQLRQLTPHNLFLLVFGQNFSGSATLGEGEPIYTEEARTFQLVDNGRDLFVAPIPPDAPNPSYRRTNFNLVPIVEKDNGSYIQSYVALSGAFTPTFGVWTVPVLISSTGSTFMADPLDPNTLLLV